MNKISLSPLFSALCPFVWPIEVHQSFRTLLFPILSLEQIFWGCALSHLPTLMKVFNPPSALWGLRSSGDTALAVQKFSQYSVHLPCL